MDLSPNYISRNGFRRIEYWIGDRGAQIRLSKQGILKKIEERHGSFSSISLYCKCIFSLFSG
jgi:hypothetical protein